MRPIAPGIELLDPQPMLATTDSRCGLIIYSGQLVAIAAPRRVLLMPAISVLESDHPRRRFVATLALVWREMRCGPEPEPYDPGVAQFYARWILMPNEHFARLSHVMSNAELAEHFNVPAEQVPAKRNDFQVEQPLRRNDEDSCVL
jgi:hypothetical protein